VPKFEAIYYPLDKEEGDVEQFLDALPVKAAAKCYYFIDRLENDGLALPAGWLEKIEGDDPLWALRPEWENKEYRLFFTLVKGAAVFIHAIHKKSQKLRKNDLKLARQRAKEVREWYADKDR